MGDEEESFLNTESILLELSFGNCKLLVLKNIIHVWIQLINTTEALPF